MLIFRLKYKDGRESKNWYYRFFHKGRKYQAAVCSSKQKAEEAALKKLMELKGQLLPEKKEGERERVLFEDLVERFLGWSKDNKRSYARDATSSKALLKLFKGRFIDTIRPHEIERYRDERKKQISGSGVNREMALMKTIYNKAIFWELIDANPVKGIKFLKENPERNRYLRHEEIEKLLNACREGPPHLEPIVAVAINTGMRPGEVQKLTWDRINLEERFIELRDTKNDEIRYVPLNDDAFNLLKTQKALNVDSFYVFTYNGNPIRRINRSFQTACRKAGIENYRPHDNRHTWASHATMSGVPQYVIQKMGGWRDGTMLKRYAHLAPDFCREVANGISPTKGRYAKGGKIWPKRKLVDFPRSVTN